jgi:MFS family permease
MISSTAGGSLAQYGKRKMIFVMSIIMSIGVAFCINNMAAITIGRFIIGLGAGGFCSYSPAYISELSPTEMSGTLGAVSQFFVTLGIAFPSWLSLLFPTDPESDKDSFWVQSFWRYFWGVPWIFAII